jgi:undecaprenyl-diphosphatase
MLQSIDAAVLLYVQDFLRIDWLSKVMMLYTTSGNSGLLWIVVSLIFLCFKRTRKAGLLALFAMLLGLLCNNYILKNLIARPRPWLTVTGLLPLMTPPDPNSFPSGHTCAAFAAAGIWWRTLPRRWMGVAAIAAAALMGFSRVYVGLHYPTDVLAGMCVGLICACAVFFLYRKWKSHNLHIR